jgi:hypothetical protein
MTRNTITTGPANGAEVMANLNGHINRLWNASALPLTSIGGTANALTATLNPPLLAGLVLGMKFTLTVAADNTAAVTLAINGATAVPVVGANGAGLTAGALRAGVRIILEWDGAALRVIAGAREGAAAGPARFTFTASGTWTVPGGYAPDTPVLLEAWGGGGGGGNGVPSGGGGGGAYAERWLIYSQLSASHTVTVGAGGGVNTNGGNSVIGSFLTAFGGGRGGDNNTAGGGGGGGEASGGDFNVTGAGGGGAPANPAASRNGGGGGGRFFQEPSPSFAQVLFPAGLSVMGGGGGGARRSGENGAGAISVQAGRGGDAGVAGTAPAGGGGSGAAGARGEVRITIFG